MNSLSNIIISLDSYFPRFLSMVNHVIPSDSLEASLSPCHCPRASLRPSSKRLEFQFGAHPNLRASFIPSHSLGASSRPSSGVRILALSNIPIPNGLDKAHIILPLQPYGIYGPYGL